MKIALILGSIILPLLMFYTRNRWGVIKRIFNLGAVLSLVIFGDIAALAIYQIIKDNTVFMTAIHAVFLNPYFLITGGYLGVYSIYLLMLLGRKEW